MVTNGRPKSSIALHIRLVGNLMSTDFGRFNISIHRQRLVMNKAIGHKLLLWASKAAMKVQDEFPQFYAYRSGRRVELLSMKRSCRGCEYHVCDVE